MDTLAAQKLLLTVVNQQQVAPSYHRLRFASEHIARMAQAGQFVHILPRSEHIHDPLLRRAFSILSVQNDTFEIMYRRVGKGTGLMTLWQAGHKVDAIGPLGKPFALFSEEDSPCTFPLLVGGGVGVPPLAMLAAQNLPGEKRILIGGRSKDDILCRDDFARCGVTIEVATEDGSEGHKGLVTELLERHLENASRSGMKFCVYSCGPLPMLRAVAALCSRERIPCQISLEESMPCGIGICNGCVVPIVGAGDEYGRYRRICMEGPVMHAQDVDWAREEISLCL
jgi:dihydroorotate dehydrogenase electron transfer subunit